MSGLMSTIYQLVKKKKWRVEKFTSSGTFTAKSDVVFLRGIGGGGNGSNSTSQSGGSGMACDMLPVAVTKGESIAVGIAATEGNTTFGSYVTLYGAVGNIGGGCALAADLAPSTRGDYFPPAMGHIIIGGHGASSLLAMNSRFKRGNTDGSYKGGAG